MAAVYDACIDVATGLVVGGSLGNEPELDGLVEV
jgi:hypothetical protein